jgi:hypothetical protein
LWAQLIFFVGCITVSTHKLVDVVVLPPQLSQIFTLYLTYQPTQLISILLQEVIALVDGQDMMTRALNLSQKALADSLPIGIVSSHQ